jgi:hypothetical protein
MPPRKAAAKPETNGTHPARPVYPPYNPEAYCLKCNGVEIASSYHSSSTRPGAGDEVIGGAMGYPEWLRRHCTGCGFSWPEMCADAHDQYAQLIREAVRAAGVLPQFGLPANATTLYLTSDGTELAKWHDYEPARLDGVGRWPEIAEVVVIVWVGTGETNEPREIRVPSPYLVPGAPATPPPAAPAPAQGGQGDGG